MNKSLGITAIVAIFLFAISIASASPPITLVVGKVYEQSIGGNGISDANIKLICKNTTMNVKSLGDGTYAAAFNESDCNDGDQLTITIEKSGYKTQTYSQVYDSTNMSQISPIYLQIASQVVVINFILNNQTSSKAKSCKSSSNSYECERFWDCPQVWTDCKNNIQTRHCTSSCGTDKIETRECSSQIYTYNQSTQSIQLESTIDKSNNIKIIAVIIIAILLIIIAYMFLKF